MERGFREAAQEGGATFVRDFSAGLEVARGRVCTVRLAGGESLGCGWFVNAAGGLGAEVAAMAGLASPVERRKRTVFALDVVERPEGRLPLIIGPFGGPVPTGGSPVHRGLPARTGPGGRARRFRPDHALFEAVIWPARARRFEGVKLRQVWAGHYDMNTLDGNAVVGPHSECANYIFANGFSGHGLQQTPDVGRALAEWMMHGEYRSLDLAPLGYGRIAAGAPISSRR